MTSIDLLNLLRRKVNALWRKDWDQVHQLEPDGPPNPDAHYQDIRSEPILIK
jgi:hypothetical protein